VRLSPNPITSPLRNKSRTTFRSHVIDSKEDEGTNLFRWGGMWRLKRTSNKNYTRQLRGKT
jgi:hypothetical protein